MLAGICLWYISCMFTDSVITLPRPTRPKTFTGLMTLYESNYLRLGWLIEDLERIAPAQVSRPPGDLPLFLDLLDVSRYTTTLRLTYFFDEDGQSVADPDLVVRIYHDARLVETLNCTARHRHSLLGRFRTAPGQEMRRRWDRNMMLNKWLEYCSEIGHRFRSEAVRDTVQAFT